MIMRILLVEDDLIIGEAVALALKGAAYAVDLREPRKLHLPAEDHAIALPCASVIVITVLLKVAATWATPEVMFFLSLRRGRAAAAGFAIVDCAPYTGRARRPRAVFGL